MNWLGGLLGRYDLESTEAKPSSRESHPDYFSETWVFVSQWAGEELVKARKSNDSSKKDDVATALLRGKIAMLKELIDLPKPKERIRRSVEETDYNDY